MINVIVELSKYVILTLMVIYTFHCFYLVKQQSEEEKNESLRQQLMLIFFMDFTAFLVIYLKTGKFQVILFYVEMMAFFAVIQILYRLIYKKASILLLNNMCMLLSVGFIMLCRLDVSTATRQLIIVSGVNAVALAVPVLIRKMKERDITVLPVIDENDKLIGEITLESAAILRRKGIKSIQEAVQSEVHSVTEDTKIEDLLPLITKTNSPIYVVNEERELKGLVPLSSIVVEMTGKDKEEINELIQNAIEL